MSIIKFTKMHGLGNDYVYIDCLKEKFNGDFSELAKKISDRHFGVGSDGLILIMPSSKADFRMRMFNADGSEAQMCGNGIRCVGKYIYDKGLTKKATVSVETLGGIKILDFNILNDEVKTVKVDMGEPVLKSSLIPVASNEDTFISKPIEVDGVVYNFTCVSMGNPHAITYVEDVKKIQIENIGPKVETNIAFPQKTNVEFIHVHDKHTLEMRVWERGSGETLACGTGACASMVASVINGFCEREATIKLLGGDLEIEWNESDNHVYMTGPAETVFEGEYYYN